MESINYNTKKSAVWCKRFRESRKLVQLLVCLGFFLDYTIITTIVPIIPELLYNIEHPDCPLSSYTKNSTVSILSDLSNIVGNITILMFNKGISNVRLDTLNETLAGTILENNTLAFTDPVALFSKIALVQNTTNTANVTKNSTDIVHSHLMHETMEIGILSSSKFVVQLFVTPLVGHFIPKYGYNGFMLYGFMSMFLACIIFAFGETYLLLILAKCLQGYGAACLSVSGLTMLADIYQDHKERATAIGLSLQGLALGNLFGPLFGGIMYELFGKKEPFLILAAISMIAVCLQLSVIKPKSTNKELIPNTILSILKDPYIVLTSVTLMMANMGNTLLESILPIWMVDTMQARRWQQGAIFTPFSVSYLISTYIFGMYQLNVKSWLIAMIGMILTGASFFVIPITRNVYELISPMAVLGVAAGMVESAMLPELGFLVDARHSAGYASVYAVGDLALCVGDTIAPVFGGILVDNIGFLSTLFIVGFLCFIFSPFISLLKIQEEKGERQLLLSQKKRRKISVVAKKVAVLTDL